PAATNMAQPLREALKARFYPYAESRGFVRAKTSHPHFTTFRRVDGDTVRVFDVQWDKYSRPMFVLNFGEGPKEGVTLWGTHTGGAELDPLDCAEGGRLQRKKGPSLACWFQLNKPLVEALRTMERHYTPEVVVNHLLDVFPELEEWWERRAIGPHLYLT